MNMIYRNATSMHIWLGEPPPDWIERVEDEGFHRFPPGWMRESNVRKELDELGQIRENGQGETKLGDNDLERVKVIVQRISAGEAWFEMPFTFWQQKSSLFERMLRWVLVLLSTGRRGLIRSGIVAWDATLAAATALLVTSVVSSGVVCIDL